MEHKNTLPKISVIIPVYNVENYIRRCLDTVTGQTYKNLEIILIDDGSTDGSGAICDEYAAADGRILVIHKENGGVSSARNAGIERSSGDYIGFVDSDDYIDEDMYEYLYEIISAGDADAARCGVYDCFAEKVYTGNHPDFYELTDNVNALRMMMAAEVSSMQMYNWLFRAAICKKVRFQEYDLGEDAMFVVDVMKYARKVVTTDKPKYYYYHRPNSLTTATMKESYMDGVKVYDKIYETALEISPALKGLAMMRRCWARMHLLDKMYLNGGEADPKLEKESIEFLKKQKKVILFDHCLTPGRKGAYLGLLVNKRIYRAIIRAYFSNRYRINES